MQQAEDTMRGVVGLLLGRCDCDRCDHRERGMM
jgi:hypothetical protein